MTMFREDVTQSHAKVVEPLHELRKTGTRRDALPLKLISGELRVKDAEKFLQGRGL